MLAESNASRQGKIALTGNREPTSNRSGRVKGNSEAFLNRYARFQSGSLPSPAPKHNQPSRAIQEYLGPANPPKSDIQSPRGDGDHITLLARSGNERFTVSPALKKDDSNRRVGSRGRRKLHKEHLRRVKEARNQITGK